MKFSWNSPAGLAPEASNIPNEIQVLNWGLIWSLRYSSDEQIIEMITEIKFAIIDLLIHSWEERLTCFDCKILHPLTITKAVPVFTFIEQTANSSNLGHFGKYFISTRSRYPTPHNLWQQWKICEVHIMMMLCFSKKNVTIGRGADSTLESFLRLNLSFHYKFLVLICSFCCITRIGL